jgi:hypothetical protein
MAPSSSRSNSSRRPDDQAYQRGVVVARDLAPMLSKHFHMRRLKSQLELNGNVVMQQFASPTYQEGTFGA